MTSPGRSSYLAVSALSDECAALDLLELVGADGAGVQEGLGFGNLLGRASGGDLADVRVRGLLVFPGPFPLSTMPLPRAIRYTSTLKKGTNARNTIQMAFNHPFSSRSRKMSPMMTNSTGLLLAGNHSRRRTAPF